MRVYLAQHGLAKEASEDAGRPLSAQGREDVARVAGFLALSGMPEPEQIIHSGKLRAEQTAGIFARRWGNLPSAHGPDLAPDSDPSLWSARLAPMNSDLMLVGHLPHMQRLAGLLLSGDGEREVVRFSNGGVVCLERGERGWSVCWQVNPALFCGEQVSDYRAG